MIIFLPNVLTFVYKIGKTNTNIPLAAGLNMQHYGQVTRQNITIFFIVIGLLGYSIKYKLCSTASISVGFILGFTH